jgi:hypothetical protein
MMHVALATAALWTGRVDEAIRRAGRARATFPSGSDPMGPTQAVAIEARALVRSGRIAEGFRLLTDELAKEPDTPGLQLLETSLAGAAATAGDVTMGRHVFHEVAGFDPDRLGESDRTVATRPHPFAAWRRRRCIPVVRRDAGAPVRGGIALGLGRVGARRCGDGEGCGSVRRGRGELGAGHLRRPGDRPCAAACAAARVGDDPAARLALDRAYEAVPLGGDRIHPTVVALAEAECLAALGADDAREAGVRATKAASAVGLDVTGWRTAFAAACGVLTPS